MIQDELKIYAIWDRKSRKYDTPFFAISDIFAKRRYLIMADEKRSPLAMWPEDFELHRVGKFNMDQGDMVGDGEIILGATKK